MTISKAETKHFPARKRNKLQNRLILQLIFGAGYGSRTRLFGLGSRRTTDVLTLRIKFHRVTFSVTILDFLISETRKPLKIQGFFPDSYGAWEADVLPLNYTCISKGLKYYNMCSHILQEGIFQS